MSEELLQRNLLNNPEKIGNWDFYNIGSTSVKTLKEHGIIRNVNYNKEEKKKVDALIVHKKNVIAVIEYKKPSEFRTKVQKEKAIKQELEVAKKLGASIIIATDTKDSIWVNTQTGNRIKDEQGLDVVFNFDPKDEKLPKLIEKIKYSINELNDQIKPKELVNPTDLAKSIWQDIWSVSGESPTNCLYTFVELFIFKYLSDLKILGQGLDFTSLMERFDYDIENPNEEALNYYAINIRPKIKDLFPINPIDKTTIINGTVFVNKNGEPVIGYSTVFKTVLDKFKKYNKGKSLENIDYDFKSKLFEVFLKEGISKKNLGQYFTPLKVVRSIVEMAKDEIKSNIKICDPACGVGKFLLEPVIKKLDQFYKIENGKLKQQITLHGFDKGFDKDEQKTIILAKANMLIYFSDLIKENPSFTKEFSKLFNETFELKTNSILGTLSDVINDEYDLILTNPPYVTSGSSNLKKEIKKNPESNLASHYKINAMGVEGLFMEWIIRALKPNGKAFIVVPDGIFNRQNDKNLRQFIIDKCFIDGIISLPINTFFTTNKKTYILAITKKNSKKDKQTFPVFSYLVSEIGESRDVYRFDIEQNDLSEAVTLFSFFKGNKENFSKINTDKRCKLFDLKTFEDNIEKSWIIDKWWTEKEKIELGITEKKENISVLDFSCFVENISVALKDFQLELRELAEKKNTKFKYTSLKLKDIFAIEKGKAKYTKKYGQQNKGEYPVYSASNNAPLTYINTYDYDGCFMTWATNGFAGYIKVIEGKFSFNADRGLLKPIKENINLVYVKNILEPKLRGLAKGRKGEDGKDEFTKVYPSMIENIEIKMPVDKNGNFDVKVQKEIVSQIIYVEEIKSQIKEYKNQIDTLNIEIDNDFEYREVLVSDKNYFKLQRGKRITKTTIEKNKGKIPVYSSSKIEKKALGFISEKYLKDNGFQVQTKPAILFNLDGSVGYCFLRTDKKYFFIDVVASLVPVVENINLTFLLYELQKEIKKTGADYKSKLYFNKIKDYELTIKIPVKSNGDFDLDAQTEIANKYKKIEEIKKLIVSELDMLLTSNIEFE